MRLESCGDIDRGPQCVVEFSRLPWIFAFSVTWMMPWGIGKSASVIFFGSVLNLSLLFGVCQKKIQGKFSAPLPVRPPVRRDFFF